MSESLTLPCMERNDRISADSVPFPDTTSGDSSGMVMKRLSEKLKEVTIMNDKWQKYNDEREKYVDGLRRDLEKTKKKLHIKEKELSETKAREREFEKTIRDHQNTISNFSKLLDDLEEKEARERTLLMRVTELESEVQSLKHRSSRQDVSSESVKLLQQQLAVCIEDFKCEKREKDKYKQEAHVLRKKSLETELLLQEYQEKIALIKSMEFPTVPRESAERYQPTRRKSSAHPRRQANVTSAKPNSWSYPSDFLPFHDVIEADAENGQGSHSDSAVDEAGNNPGLPARPLFEIFPQLKLPADSADASSESDSVFAEENDEGELVRR